MLNPLKKKRPLETEKQKRINELATIYVQNSRTRQLLKLENENISKELIELMQYYGKTKELDISISFTDRQHNKRNEQFTIRLIDSRGKSTDMKSIAIALMRPILIAFLNDNKDMIRNMSIRLAEIITEYMAKDGFLIRKLLDTKPWAKKYITENKVKPYISVTDQFGDYL